jgi:hypothetical protein
MAPFYQATVSGPFSVPGTPVGLIETSGADLTSLNVNTTPTLSIRAVLPYEVQVYPAFPFEFGSPNTGYLEWELVRASDNAILSSGNSNFPFGTNSCGLPTNSPNECSYETNVSVSGLAPGDYQIRGRIIPPLCPGSGGPVTPIPTSPLNFTVTVGTGTILLCTSQTHHSYNAYGLANRRRERPDSALRCAGPASLERHC